MGKCNINYSDPSILNRFIFLISFIAAAFVFSQIFLYLTRSKENKIYLKQLKENNKIVRPPILRLVENKKDKIKVMKKLNQKHVSASRESH